MSNFRRLLYAIWDTLHECTWRDKILSIYDEIRFFLWP